MATEQTERFNLQPSKDIPDGWVCADKETGVVVRWIKGDFNESQNNTVLEDIPRKMSPAEAANKYARAAREMADWLRENHYELLF
jgi:hypothetical protein